MRGRFLIVAVVAGVIIVAGAGALYQWLVPGLSSARTEQGPLETNVATWLLHQSVPATAKARTNPLGNDPAEIAAGGELFKEKCEICHAYDGGGKTEPAALPPPIALRVRGGLPEIRSTAMPRTSAVHAVTTIGIDMGKNTLHMIGLDTRGGIVLREKVSRGRITSRLANLPSCLIGIEAGMATHYVARELAALGHDVKQVPPTYAKPFRQGHKMISEMPMP